MGVNKLQLSPKRLWHRNAKNIVGLGTMLEKEKMVVFLSSKNHFCNKKKPICFFRFYFPKIENLVNTELNRPPLSWFGLYRSILIILPQPDQFLPHISVMTFFFKFDLFHNELFLFSNFHKLNRFSSLCLPTPSDYLHTY